MTVLRQICTDEHARFPLATQVFENNTYMDALCYSMPLSKNSLRLRDDHRELVKAGGLELSNGQATGQN